MVWGTEVEMTETTLMGIRVLEPVTSATDLLTACTAYTAWWLLGRTGADREADRLFRLYFLLIGIATTFAGLAGHAFLYVWGDPQKVVGWIFSGLGILAIERAAIAYAHWLTPGQRRLRLIFVFTQFGIFLLSVLYPETSSFENVKLNSALGLLIIVGGLHLEGYRRDRTPGRAWVLGAIAWGLIPAFTFNTKFSLHTWFNYHDISHVLMAISMLIMYLGARRLAIRPPVVPAMQPVHV
ncbi:MAG: hypothetical protein SF053_13275 [Bacteroidia bacterium]|nr:hypothetical protein [Bacteroidia bacterium]